MIPQEAKLLDRLSNNDVTFFIPPYQRNYEWSEEQCSVFLEDVYKVYEQNAAGGKSEHFFGSVTYFQTEAAFGQPNKLVLIDGQQRITTTMLFLAALRDITEEPRIREFIDLKYLKNNNVPGEMEYKIKLKQVETDWGTYKNIILGEEVEDNSKMTPVYRNYMYFANKLKSYAAGGVNLTDLIEKGLNRFSVITIELQPDKNPWENPQEIFESMNSIGKPLSLADLVRNYLLLGLDADTQTKLYNQYWLHIEKIIPGQVSNYIRDFMQAKEMRSILKATETNYKELYSLFKQIFRGYDAKKLIKELSDSAIIYSYILSIKSSGNKKIDYILKDLRTANVTTAYSFLLALLREWKQEKFSDADVISILNVIRIYILRRRLIGVAAAENKAFPALTAHIFELIRVPNKDIKMFEILAKQENNLRIPNDIEIER